MSIDRTVRYRKMKVNQKPTKETKKGQPERWAKNQEPVVRDKATTLGSLCSNTDTISLRSVAASFISSTCLGKQTDFLTLSFDFQLTQ